MLLTRVNLQLIRNAEFADAMMGDLNSVLARLQSTGLLPSTVIFGPKVLARVYEVGISRTDSGQVIQAVLTLPGGIGAVYWDTEVWFRAYRVVRATIHTHPLDCHGLVREIGDATVLAALCGLIPEPSWPAVLLIHATDPDPTTNTCTHCRRHQPPWPQAAGFFCWTF